MVGTYDAIAGVEETANGYYAINFGDDSELWLKHTGTSKGFSNGKVEQKGTAIVISGKGRNAGAKGEGKYQGESTQSPLIATWQWITEIF